MTAPQPDAGTIPDPAEHPFFTVADPVPPPRRFFGPALAVWVTVCLVCAACLVGACVGLWRLT